MAIFGRKKNKKEGLHEVIVNCRCKEEEITVLYSNIDAMPTGYKGRLTFYTECPYCGHRIYINEAKLSMFFVRKMYVKHFDGR